MNARNQLIALGGVGPLMRRARGSFFSTTFTIVAKYMERDWVGGHQLFNAALQLLGASTTSGNRIHFIFRRGSEAWNVAHGGDWARFVAEKLMLTRVPPAPPPEEIRGAREELLRNGVLSGQDLRRLLNIMDGSGWRIHALRFAATGAADAIDVGSLILVRRPGVETIMRLVRIGEEMVERALASPA